MYYGIEEILILWLYVLTLLPLLYLIVIFYLSTQLTVECVYTHIDLKLWAYKFQSHNSNLITNHMILTKLRTQLKDATFDNLLSIGINVSLLFAIC